MAKVGRNDHCPCGSGKKYKRCCEPAARAMSGRMRLVILLVAGAVAAAVIAGIVTRSDDGGAGRVWSAEHGHYH